MSNFLNPENSVMQFLARVCDYLILNVVFILSCIPIFTVGAALSALYTVSFKMLRKEDGYVLKRYFKAFCANFKQGTILWLICLILFFFLQYDGLIIGSMGGSMGQILSILFYTIVLVLAAMFLYLWPILAYFVCTTKQVVKNALYMCLGHLPWTALLLLYFGLVWFIMTRSTLTLGIVVAVSMAGGFSLTAWITGKIFLKIFARYQPETSPAKGQNE